MVLSRIRPPYTTSFYIHRRYITVLLAPPLPLRHYVGVPGKSPPRELISCAGASRGCRLLRMLGCSALGGRPYRVRVHSRRRRVRHSYGCIAYGATSMGVCGMCCQMINYEVPLHRPMFTEGRIAGAPMGGFISAETLVLNDTTGDNGTAGGTLNQPVLGFLVGCNSLWAAFRPVTPDYLLLLSQNVTAGFMEAT